MIINEKSKSLEEQVYAQLEEEILCGLYKKGTSLTEMSLSERLGVSRTPVRAALHRLAAEGLVEILPNRGAVVIGVTLGELEDTYRIRMRLEGLASAIAANKLTDGEKERLSEIVDLNDVYLAKNDLQRIKELDAEFHGIIFRASGNRMLCRILDELHRNIRTYRELSLTIPGRLEKSNQEHREILQAMLDGDAEKADIMTSLHIERAMKNMVAAMEKQEKQDK